MIGAKKHSKQSDIPTIKMTTCPACNKDRLGQYVNEDGSVTPVNTETVEVRGQERFLEVCGFCMRKYQREDERFAKENLKRLAKAIHKDNVPDGESDHRDFSLN